MDVKHHINAQDFLAHAGKFLSKDEARYGLILGIATTLTENKYYYGTEAPWFCTVSADPRPMARLGSEMYAAALRTPPHLVVLAHFSGSIDLLANELVAAVGKRYKEIPGVVGGRGLADRFSARWCGTHKLRVTHTQAQRIYKLEKVNDVPLSPGKMRAATEADKELVKKWSHSFHLDCFGIDSNIPEGDCTLALAAGRIFFWEVDGKPVSMALKTRATDKSMSVGGVYTPPELRGKGYATSCVSELSRHILQNGYRFCTLYADLSNPASNAIYKKIGYAAVADFAQHTFGQ